MDVDHEQADRGCEIRAKHTRSGRVAWTGAVAIDDLLDTDRYQRREEDPSRLGSGSVIFSARTSTKYSKSDRWCVLSIREEKKNAARNARL